MKENNAVQNALATIGAVFWTIQIIPQIVKSYRSKSTLGLSAILMATWAISCLPFASYIVASHLSIPLQIQPHVFGFLSAVSWTQCLYHEHKYSKLRAGACLAGFVCLWVGFETGSVYALWAGERNGTTAPIQFYGYLSAVLLSAALIPQYWEIYKLREVIGISLIFMTIDILGGVFSFLSLFFRQSLDVAAFISYLLVVLLDGIVVILALVLNPRVKRRRAMERVLDQEAGVSSATMLTGGKGGHAALPTPAIPVEEGQQPDPAVEDRSEKGADALGEIPEARESEVSRPLKYPDIETA